MVSGFLRQFLKSIYASFYKSFSSFRADTFYLSEVVFLRFFRFAFFSRCFFSARGKDFANLDFSKELTVSVFHFVPFASFLFENDYFVTLYVA